MEPIGNTVSPFPNQPTVSKKKSPVIIIIIIAVLLLGGGFFIFRQGKKTSQPQVSGFINKEPTPTEKPKVDKEKVKIDVRNGTGTPGQAGSAVEALKKSGYSVDNIKTGNAVDYNHTVTTIAAKSGFEDIASDIKTVLGSLFDKIEIDSSPVVSDNQYDIVITTGGKKYETPTPTSTASATPSVVLTPTLTPTSTLTPIPTR